MLKNLIKYEWKAVWKALLIINAFTVAVTFLGMIAMHSLSYNGGFHTDDHIVMTILLFLFYYATIMGVSFAMTIYIAVRFYRNLYTEEGYLMHTLPVTKRQLVISKLLVHFVCMCITGILVCASVCLLLLPLMARITEDPSVSVFYLIKELTKSGTEAYGLLLPAVFILYVLASIIGQLSGILSVYCAVSLGQTFQKHKVMGSILCYVGIYFLLQTITTFAMTPQLVLSIRNTTQFDLAAYLNGTLLTVSIISLFTGIVFYIITLHMMEKRLNLD